MEIKDLEDLAKLAQVCRKSGIDSIEVGDLKVTFNGETPKRKRVAKETQLTDQPAYNIDQLIDWSSQGIGADN
jgi:hypothetical protein